MAHYIDVLFDEIEDSIDELLAEVVQAESPEDDDRLPDLDLLTMPRLRGFRRA